MSPLAPLANMVNLAPRGNDALKNNPPTGAQAHITTHGSDWLWAVFAVFLFVDVCLFIWCMFRPPGTRLLNQLAIIILTIGAWDYFAQASNLGWTTTATSFNHYTPKGTRRQVFWCWYVDWILTAPLLLIMIAFHAGAHWRDIMAVCFAGAIVWVGWLLGALIGPSQYKWAYYVFAVVMGMFFVWYALFLPIRRSAKLVGGRYRRLQLLNAGWYSFMLVMYAIAWGCTDGGNTVSNTSQAVWIGILDLLTKPFWLIFFLIMTKDTDYHLLRQTRYKQEIGDHGRPDPVLPHNDGHSHYNTHHHGAHDAEAAAAGAGAGAAVAGDPEKKHGRKFFSRRGAHDDRTVPATRGAVGADATAGEHGPPRMSNATMVDPEGTATDHTHGMHGMHGTHGTQGAPNTFVHSTAPGAAHTHAPGATHLAEPAATVPGTTQTGAPHL